MNPDELTEEPDKGGVVFDARNQYYRVWMWLVAQSKVAMIEGDPERWRRCVLALYMHARSFLADEDRKHVDEKLREAQNAAYGLVLASRRGYAYAEAAGVHRRTLEDALTDAERRIYDGMKAKNMLLPQSQGDGGELDIEKILGRADM